MQRAVRFAVLVMLAGGCATQPETLRSPIAWQSLKAGVDAGSDRVLLDVSLIERPLDDEYLNEGLWSCADEMVIAPELRELLAANGYRVGVLVGAPPEKLVQLLSSERSCIDRRGKSVPSGANVTQTLRTGDDATEGYLHLGKMRSALTFDRPRFGLELSPVAGARDLVRLTITPRYEDGDKTMNIKAVPEESKWEMEIARPHRLLAELAFSVALSANQVLIIGPRLEQEGSLGHHSFVHVRNEIPTQRLLVLRHLRTPGPSGPSEPVMVEFPNNPPLAMQAAK